MHSLTFTFQSRSSADEKKAGKHEDVVMKVIRVVANLSINEEVGQAVATSVPCVEYLINILGECKVSLRIYLPKVGVL